MRYAALVVLAFGLGACTQAQDDHAREQARVDAERAKHDAQEALQKAKVETRKASRELDKDLHEARDKARQALNQPDNSGAR